MAQRAAHEDADGLRRRKVLVQSAVDDFGDGHFHAGALGELAQLQRRSRGKPLIESWFEVAEVLEHFQWVIAEAPEVLERRAFTLPQLPFMSKRNLYVHHPHGVCALVMPWNFPLAITTGEILQALVGGNAVVLKPSEFTPFVSLLVAELFLEGGLAPGLVNVVTGDGRTGATLVASAVDKVAFTGSFDTGVKIMTACAARGVPCTAELGGKDPAIVLEDANLGSAVLGTLWCGLMNAGQSCSSTERVYVARSIHDRFVELAGEVASRLKVGDGRDLDVEVGPLIALRQIEKVESQVQAAIAGGARDAAGGKALPELGPYFYAPTVLSGVDDGMRIMKDETFGPVVPVVPFDSIDDAIRLANDTPYGLSATIWTGDVDRGEQLASRIRAGAVWINDGMFSHSAPQTPWGGPGRSGNSRTHGRWGIESYVRLQYVSSDAHTGTLKDGWYPYGPARLRYIQAAVDWLYRPGVIRKLAALPRVLAGFVRRCPPPPKEPDPES
ncbi:MAG: aldehyde dehydrogenase [Candidatus Riflebacteria bacterium]|nr:aldehyde dehydrogenase [Candidatus Riflebacteria bacterium]